YNGAKYEAKILARFIDIPSVWKIDAVVPVPLHCKRIKKRGFNQSELIAKHLCENKGLKLDTSLLIRGVDTKQQARMTEAGRKRNVKGAFIADDRCRGASVLLLDDVCTTGATLSECAKELKKHGCEKVYAVTVCFVKPD
ncbi:MAG: ComF family protein, partial [Clostridiales bacterium]|nr:ComF family protein [Clostridiales bacterium]